MFRGSAIDLFRLHGRGFSCVAERTGLVIGPVRDNESREIKEHVRT
jgi:hypothetical protein